MTHIFQLGFLFTRSEEIHYVLYNMIYNILNRSDRRYADVIILSRDGQVERKKRYLKESGSKVFYELLNRTNEEVK